MEEPDLGALFELMDVNQDGSLDEHEILPKLAGRPGVRRRIDVLSRMELKGVGPKSF